MPGPDNDSKTDKLIPAQHSLPKAGRPADSEGTVVEINEIRIGGFGGVDGTEKDIICSAIAFVFNFFTPKAVLDSSPSSFFKFCRLILPSRIPGRLL